MNSFVNRLYGSVSQIKHDDEEGSVFVDISPVYYRENYHSDILCYLLKMNHSMRYFVEWMNKYVTTQIDYRLYQNSLIDRESNRIDILIYSDNRKNAIIIENKSNDAVDQTKQIAKYHRKLSSNGIKVDAILYLNKNLLKEPYFGDLRNQEVGIINDKLVISQLIGVKSITDEFLNKIIEANPNTRSASICIEVKNMFKYIIVGGIDMDKMKKFEEELKSNNGYGKLHDIVESYNELPFYWATKYKKYMELNNRNVFDKIWIYQDICLVLDKTINKKEYAIDIRFNNPNVEYQFFCRSNNKHVELIKTIMREKFPFVQNDDGEYVINGCSSIDEKNIIKQLDYFINSFSFA